MAAYTHLSDDQIEGFLKSNFAYDFKTASPISAGTENTNYHIKTSKKEFVLTLFEEASYSEVEPYIALTQHLANKGILVPATQTNEHGVTIFPVSDKPTILTNFVSGQHLLFPSEQDCYQVASELAKIHLSSFAGELPSYELLDSINNMYAQAQHALSEEDAQIINGELQVYNQHSEALKALPSGVLHTDLFKDNALYADHKLSAILDFYSAAYGPFLFDLGVLINDWCFTDDGDVIEENMSSVLKGYQAHRCLTKQENKSLPLALRMTACRFWLSRSMLRLKHDKILDQKNPQTFKQRLILHVTTL